MVDAAPAAAHIAMLRAANMALGKISARSGLRRNHLDRIAKGAYRRVESITSDMLLAVQPEQDWVPVLVIKRRLDALNCLGFSDREIGRRGGIHQVRGLLRSKKCTSRAAAPVIALYDELCTQDATGPQASRTRVMAAKKKFAPPEAWTDETIDDPDAKPWGHVPGRRWDVDPVKVWRATVQTGAFPLVGLTRAERHQVVTQLMERGLDSVQIAEFTGWHVRSVVRVRAELRGRGTWDEYALRLRCKHQAVSTLSPDEVARADARTSLADLAELAAHTAELAGQGVAA